MTAASDRPAGLPPLARIQPRLLLTAATGGLIGGLGMFFVMAGYNATGSMGFWTILNVCFAAWVFRGSTMTSHSAMTHEMMGHHGMGAAAMMNQPILASHVIVGGLLHLAMSAAVGAVFAIVLAVLIRSGVRALATPGGYVFAATAGGGLLYVIMMYGFAPLWNTEIVDFTPRVPFFLGHLLYGATVGGWMYWRAGHGFAGIRTRIHRPRLGTA